MRYRASLALVFVLLAGTVSLCGSAQAQTVVNFTDPNLEAVVREAIDKPTGDIHDTDLVGVGFTRLDGASSGIADLSGLEYCTDLIDLYLAYNAISDLTPLAGLTNLQGASLHHNQVADISPLAGLTNLAGLVLDWNQVTDITPLAGLVNLDWLYLNANQIADLSALSGLTNLTGVFLDRNQITDISPLEPLSNLLCLDLSHNEICDIGTLSELTGLGYLYLSHNCISDIGVLQQITYLAELELGGNQISGIGALEGKTWVRKLDLHDNQIVDITALASFTRLETARLEGNSIVDVSPLAGLSNLEWLWLRDNQIGDISPLAANPGIGENVFVNLVRDPLNAAALATHIPAMEARGAVVYHGDVGQGAGVQVDIPDPFLEEAVRDGIGKPTGDILDTDLAGLGFVFLAADSSGISDLTGLEHCTDLRRLDLSSNHLGDLSPLGGLVNLTDLNLYITGVSDIAPLAGLTGLVTLQLGANEVADISPLSALRELTALGLSYNRITDVSALAGLTGLSDLELYLNRITDITPLAGLTHLSYLGLDWNAITDITPLAGLTGLSYLNLDCNAISDITPLAGLTGLVSLDIEVNEIADISPLSALTELTELGLSYNRITDVSALAALTALTLLSLDGNRLTGVASLAGLEDLQCLYLCENQISDLGPLGSLSALKEIYLHDNQINDLDALVANSGVGADDTVDVTHNPLSREALCDDVPELDQRGVSVTYDGACLGLVEGYVTDAVTGAGLACAAVVASSEDSTQYIGVTDITGAYTIDGLPASTYTVEVFSPDYEPWTTSVVISEGGELSLDAALQPAGVGTAITGAVTDANTGLPLAGVRVDVLQGDQVVATTYTCASGAYALRLATKADIVTLQFSAQGYETQTQDVSVVQGQTTMANAQLTPKASLPGLLSGSVYDAETGEAVSEAQVAASMTAIGSVTLTDESGQFVFPALEPGRYRVRVSATGYESQARNALVNAGDTWEELSFRLTPSSSPPPNGPGCQCTSPAASLSGNHARDVAGDGLVAATVLAALLIAGRRRCGTL